MLPFGHDAGVFWLWTDARKQGESGAYPEVACEDLSWSVYLTDVFVRVYAQNHLRLAMVNLALTRWLMEPDVNVQVIAHKDSMGIEMFSDQFVTHTPSRAENFCVESKKIAETLAKSDVYVLADDDQLIVGKDWVKRGVGFVDRGMNISDGPLAINPKPFAFLAARSICGEVPDSSLSGNIVSEHPSQSVGTPYFIRKGLITDFPAGDEQGGGSYDTIFSKHCIDKGYKVGFIRDLRFNHLGSGYSTVVQGHWGA